MLVETAFSENKVSVHILFQDCSKFTNGQANMVIYETGPAPKQIN